jgi:hypothetical protein
MSIDTASLIDIIDVMSLSLARDSFDEELKLEFYGLNSAIAISLSLDLI